MGIKKSGLSDAVEFCQTAMMLLEMYGTKMFDDPDADAGLVVGAHALVQNVLAVLQGRPLIQEVLIAETLALVKTRVAIENAKSPMFKE